MTISKTAARAALKLRKHSPQLLFGAGIIGTVATVVVACRATLKAQDVSANHKLEVSVADDRLDQRVYDEGAHRHHIVTTWTQTSIEYTKLYGPTFILGVTSIACLTKSHQILTSRNAAVMAAYAGLDRMFKEYRTRVITDVGLEKDNEYAYGTVEKEIVEYDKKGNAEIKRYSSTDPDARTVYGRWFDETNRHWDKDHGYNHTFLDNQQKWANLQLKRQGHLFLNEVYDMLGIPRSKEGAQVGWYYDNDDADGYVDFGFNRHPEFVAGFERTVFLDFNVDGMILDFI